jgi:hypothetical protein
MNAHITQFLLSRICFHVCNSPVAAPLGSLRRIGVLILTWLAAHYLNEQMREGHDVEGPSSFFGILKRVWVRLDLQSIKTRCSKGLVDGVNELEPDACLSFCLRGSNGS